MVEFLFDHLLPAGTMEERRAGRPGAKASPRCSEGIALRERPTVRPSVYPS
jgi:hypothetical protein